MLKLATNLHFPLPKIRTIGDELTLSQGLAQRACTHRINSTPKESSSLSWAETMEKEDPIEGPSSLGMEVDGEEHDARGMRLFNLTDRTESLIRPHFSGPGLQFHQAADRGSLEQTKLSVCIRPLLGQSPEE